jgi:hypothetical protein
MLHGRLRQDDYEINRLVLGGKVHTAADAPSPGMPRVDRGQLTGPAPVLIHASITEAASPKSVIWGNPLV